ncbi:MAG: DUF481 domain-containing protein [Gammaproteobacteria bacterium]|nr:DUF481 domain-containing protein [Gammaproteobacteria bacterium]
MIAKLNRIGPRVLAFMSLIIAGPVTADVIVMTNGDRITGSISRIWDAEVFIEPSYADEFAVDVGEIAYIEAKRKFEITLESGREVFAELLGADDEGNQIVAYGSELIAVPLGELAELEEPEDFFEWESNIDLSVGINKGNTDSQNGRLQAAGQVKWGEHRHRAELIFNREETDGITNREQDIFRYGYNWLFRDPWFVTFNADAERDPIRDLDSRIILSAGVGRDIWNQPARRLNFSLGLGYQSEKIGSNDEDSSVAIWNFRFEYELFNRDLETYHNHTFYTTLSGRTNTVLKTSTGLAYEISDLLYTTISVDYDYESDPADFAENDDLALLLGLGLEFD